VVFRDSFDQCPRCGITLEDADSARGCRNCGGMFIEQPVLAEMLLQMLPPPPRVWGSLSLSEVARGGQALGCPQCGDAMKPTDIHGVELDHCAKHGVWFDQDELRITLYRVADPKNPPPFKAWEPSPFVEMPLAPPPRPKPSSDIPVRGPYIAWHVVQNGGPPREVTTTTAIIKIGTLGTCHIPITGDPTVSRMHAVIEATADEVTVIDLGSRAGTYINDQKITKANIVVGDTVRVGATELVLMAVVP
jgi:Zn-finger nucleic acid-binding protein